MPITSAPRGDSISTCSSQTPVISFYGVLDEDVDHSPAASESSPVHAPAPLSALPSRPVRRAHSCPRLTYVRLGVGPQSEMRDQASPSLSTVAANLASHGMVRGDEYLSSLRHNALGSDAAASVAACGSGAHSFQSRKHHILEASMRGSGGIGTGAGAGGSVGREQQLTPQQTTPADAHAYRSSPARLRSIWSRRLECIRRSSWVRPVAASAKVVPLVTGEATFRNGPVPAGLRAPRNSSTGLAEAGQARELTVDERLTRQSRMSRPTIDRRLTREFLDDRVMPPYSSPQPVPASAPPLRPQPTPAHALQPAPPPAPAHMLTHDHRRSDPPPVASTPGTLPDARRSDPPYSSLSRRRRESRESFEWLLHSAERAFWLLAWYVERETRLVIDSASFSYFDMELSGLRLDLGAFPALVATHLPALAAHCGEIGLDCSMFVVDMFVR